MQRKKTDGPYGEMHSHFLPRKETIHFVLVYTCAEPLMHFYFWWGVGVGGKLVASTLTFILIVLLQT